MDPTFSRVYSDEEVEFLAKEFPLLRDQKKGKKFPSAMCQAGRSIIIWLPMLFSLKRSLRATRNYDDDVDIKVAYKSND